MRAHRTALVLPAAAGGLVAHQLINHPGGDAGVFQPGREGMAEIMRAIQGNHPHPGSPGVRACPWTSTEARPAECSSIKAPATEAERTGRRPVVLSRTVSWSTH